MHVRPSPKVEGTLYSYQGMTLVWLAFIALVMATINVVGGFMVTNKMLEMIAGKKRGGN